MSHMRCFVSDTHTYTHETKHTFPPCQNSASIQNTQAPLVLMQSFAWILHPHHTRDGAKPTPSEEDSVLERKMELKALIHWINTNRTREWRRGGVPKTYRVFPLDSEVQHDTDTLHLFSIRNIIYFRAVFSFVYFLYFRHIWKWLNAVYYTTCPHTRTN